MEPWIVSRGTEVQFFGSSPEWIVIDWNGIPEAFENGNQFIEIRKMIKKIKKMFSAELTLKGYTDKYPMDELKWNKYFIWRGS